MINIGATFVCTLLAYQIVGLRKSSQKLERQLQEKEDELKEKQRLLSSLTDEKIFARPVAQQCQGQVAAAATSNSGWGRSSTASADYTDSFSDILQQALKKRIGSHGLSDLEKRDQIAFKLQQAKEELQKDVAAAVQGADEPELVEILERESGAKVVRKRNFSI